MTIDVAAVDLGASSGRVVRGTVGPDHLSIETVARFPNGPVQLGGGLHWDLPALLERSLAGLRAAGPVASIGVDSWAVDYGLLRGPVDEMDLLGLPWCYRDERTAAGVEAVHARIGPDELYRRTGLQFLPFNTIYQLAAETRVAEADRLLLVPDLMTYWLTGQAVCERTNASTTGLLDVRTGSWDPELLSLVGVAPGQLAELVEPGTVVGHHDGTPVVTVGSHDTASAVVGVPMTQPDAAYVSCGTWGLVGLELDAPIVTDASRAANFTNEGGVDGRVRFLTNVMGTWLLSETMRSWGSGDLGALLDRAAAYDGPLTVFDVQDHRFLAPNDQHSDMPRRIADWCHERDLPAPDGRDALVRSIVASLAEGFATAVEKASSLSGSNVRRVHVVGGGAQNTLLCGLLADRLGLPVLAGPVEATALGNVLAQARAHGALSGSLEDLRALVARTQTIVVHQPQGVAR